MSNDVLITPASRKIEFKDSSANVDAKIETDASGNLLITNTGGDISIGDTTSDIFVGDGTNNIDIVFEQDGEIRGTSGVTVTLGASGSNIRMASDLNLNSNDITNVGDLTVTGNLTVSGTTTTVDSTNTTITDSIIELNSGLTGANTKDIGFVFERGSTGNNAAFIWDESADRFTVITTTGTASDNTLSGTVANFQAGSFFGNGANLTALNGTNISSGTVAAARIASLAASKITSGTFADARIPSLAASKITSGTFADARIPNLAASKITSGSFGGDRIATGSSGDWWSGNAVKVATDGVSEVGKYLDFHNTDAGTSDFDTRLYSSGTDQLTINGSGRIFTDGYHPNADTLTTARTIAGTSFNGSANIDINYNNLTNKPTIPSSSTFLALAGGTMTGAINAGGGINGLTISNGISGNNFNISGVNQLSLNDPGEGILFGSNCNLYLLDDAADNILRLDAPGGFRLHDGPLSMGTTTVIDTSRNLTNIGTISSGAITSSGDFTFSSTARIRADGVINFLTTGGSAQTGLFKAVAAQTSYANSASTGMFNALNGYAVGTGTGTTVIDSSRNLTNIGTISSGNITIADDGTPVLTLSDTGNAGGGGAAGKILFSNTGGNAMGIGYTGNSTAD